MNAQLGTVELVVLAAIAITVVAATVITALAGYPHIAGGIGVFGGAALKRITPSQLESQSRARWRGFTLKAAFDRKSFDMTFRPPDDSRRDEPPSGTLELGSNGEGP